MGLQTGIMERVEHAGRIEDDRLPFLIGLPDHVRYCCHLVPSGTRRVRHDLAFLTRLANRSCERSERLAKNLGADAGCVQLRSDYVRP
jgi:hypothetical protein